MEINQTDAGTQFTLQVFREGLSIHGVQLALATPGHQEMNYQVEFILQTLRTIKHSIMVHARVSERYIHFSLMYMTDHIFPVLPTKHLVNQYGEPTTPQKLATGTKLSVSNLRVLLCPYVYKSQMHMLTQRR